MVIYGIFDIMAHVFEQYFSHTPNTTLQDELCESVLRTLSAIYDIPHGGGLAILFPNWMKYVIDDGTDKLKQFAIKVWGVNPANKDDKEITLEGIEKTREFFVSIGAPLRLSDYNIGAEHIDLMAEMAVKGMSIGQFKKLYKEDVKNILMMSL